MSSELIDHAITELTLLEFAQGKIDTYLDIFRAFEAAGYSRNDPFFDLTIVSKLLQYENLSNLTSSPDEWKQVATGLWQSYRNQEAFSTDAGVTYYKVGDSLSDNMDSGPQYMVSDPPKGGISNGQ